MVNHFNTMVRHVHTIAGNAAMMGLETLSDAASGLETLMEQAKEPPGISEVPTPCIHSLV